MSAPRTTKDGHTVPRRFPLRIHGADRPAVLVDIHTPGRGSHRARWFLMGWQFGPVAAILATSAGDAVDEWDEHYGERVDPDDPALSDYVCPPDASARSRVCAAMDAGDVRINGGGTTVWVDPHETMRELRTPLRYFPPEARALLRP